MTVQAGSEIFRDYETDAVPASGVHPVSKSEMRAWMTAVESALDINQPSEIAQATYRLELARRQFLFNIAV